ncbi:MAG: GNAT family N-acetyltransferase [Actinocatenispora sp.]
MSGSEPMVLDGASVRGIDVHDDVVLRAWYDTTRVAEVAGRAEPQVFSYESLRASLRDPNPDYRRIPYAAFDGATIVGTLLVGLPQRDNTHLADVAVHVPVDRRGRGVGSALLAHAERIVTDAGRTTVTAEAFVPAGVDAADWPGARFGHRHGFSTEHQEDHLVLDLPAAGVVPGPVPGYDVVSWVGGCPDEYVEGYAAMRTRMEQDVPSGTLDVQPGHWDAARVQTSERRLAAQGYTPVTSAARRVGGEFAGYSQVLVPEHDPGQVYQEDTLVMPEHRGHGLGGALKAANLRILSERWPDRRRLHTWTAGTNAAMHHVNTAFGFRVVETLHELQRRLPA